jgi:phage shock protein PspC (stress-responsive transcriptional regulator)
METKRLYRSCKDKVLGGVAGGLGEYFSIDPVLIRIIFLLLLFTGVGFLIYLVAWIVVPVEPGCEKNAKEKPLEEKIEDFAQDVQDKVKSHTKNTGKDGSRKLFGAIILIVGLILLIQTVFSVSLWSNFWPTILILAGLALVFTSKK